MPLKQLLLFATAALFVSACGVKGPPEPPLPTEASVKKTVSPPPTDTTDQAAPVIFPTKEGKKKKDASKKQGP